MYYLYLIFLWFLIFETNANFCQCSQMRYRSKLRGNYKDVLKYDSGSLLVSRKTNLFRSTQSNGLLSRETIYQVDGGTGYTYCALGGSIIVELHQVYELNTFIFWLWDRSPRTYGFIVYACYENIETVILDSVGQLVGVVRINFPNQMVKYFKIFNRNGNTSNTQLHIIKAMAFFQL
ncbi:unnamed protein product [Paramecium sonneborni]|uniref:Uncharacterized protein n=1 Tax=Paramecium sonneborni TaxID=65129 RepID=A0A8S1LAX8_9CILI|nr:unnamed protein product [Paramecium sonneborni]